MDTVKWKNEIETLRKQKNDFFGSYQSPLATPEKYHFNGLRYYAPDTAYRLELELHEYHEKVNIKMKDTKGATRDFLRYGEFRFEINGGACTLQAYISDIEEDRLFLPFKDATTGQETYPAGRYLDLTAERDRLPNGKWILDFNLAYNPWCAYSDNFACPLTPAENTIQGRIRAGEKHYPRGENQNTQ